jgi:hypothetical protein
MALAWSGSSVPKSRLVCLTPRGHVEPTFRPLGAVLALLVHASSGTNEDYRALLGDHSARRAGRKARIGDRVADRSRISDLLAR